MRASKVISFGDFECEIIGRTQKVRITKYLGEAEVIKIPSTIVIDYKKYKVTELGNGVTSIITPTCSWCCAIKEVILPETIKVILSYCFYKFYGSRISGPGLDSVITVGSFAFAFSNITEIEFGTNLNFLGSNAFSGSKYLKRIDLQKTKINNLLEHVVSGCDSLVDLLLPNTLKSVCSRALYECHLEELSLPYSVIDFCLDGISDSYIKKIYFNSYPRFIYCDKKEFNNLKNIKICVPENIIDSIRSTYSGLDICGIDSSTIKYEILGNSAIVLPKPDDSGFRNLYSGNFIVPKNIYFEGRFYRVSEMDPFAFSNCKDLISITIPKGFKLIKDFIDRHIKIYVENA